MIPPFVLASASPARRRLLETVGIKPIIHQSDFDESQIQLTDTVALVETLARCKAETVASQLEQSLILGCDSLLVVNGESYGKPESAEIAIARWQGMRGQIGFLYTGHVLIDQTQDKKIIRCGLTQVHFADIDDSTIKAYVESQEPLNCAGAFAIEGKGGLFIDKIDGCHTNVIGLSLPLLRKMISQLGYQVTDFW
ncbi:MAG: septum formation inhibitor Maf [Snowella sp.]|jgi:septum formation protein|nr:MAG: septum formation inhibitor Maf [Snowella sp.]